MRPVGMLSDAALPLMILVLGMQIERATMPERPVVVAAAVAVSLVLTPLAAIGWAHVVGLRGAAFQAGVLQSSMPTAVMTTILALEFDALPQFVTSVVCVATLLSPLTVTLLIAYLQGIAQRVSFTLLSSLFSVRVHFQVRFRVRVRGSRFAVRGSRFVAQAEACALRLLPRAGARFNVQEPVRNFVCGHIA